MALPENQHRQLTEADRLYCFKRCTSNLMHFLGQGPKTDAEIATALHTAIGQGGGCGPDTPSYEYNGNGLRIWAAWEWPNPRTHKPLWSGATTVAMARQVYGIKTPQEFAEPSLFDFAGISTT